MPLQTYESLLNTPTPVAAGAALASSVVLTDISPTPNYVLPANYLYPGAALKLTAYGNFSTTGTPTLLLGFYYGAVAGALPLAATLATTTGSGVTNVPWRMELIVNCRSVGTSGTVMCNGVVNLGTSVSAWTVAPIPQIALATVTVDTTAAKAITVGAQWGTSSASNTITQQSPILVEALN